MAHMVTCGIYHTSLLSLLEGWESSLKVDSTGLGFLQMFANEPYSAYGISTYLQSRKKPLDYKNVYRRVHYLFDSGLIEAPESNTKESTHNAQYFHLSEKGVFYLIRNTSGALALAPFNSLAELFKTLLRNYKYNKLFELVLYPYFEIDTFQRMYGTVQLYAIWRYLQSCCEEIESASEIITNTEPGGEQIFIWNDVRPGKALVLKKLTDKRLWGYLKRELKSDWLDNAEIIKFEDNRRLKIFHRNNSILIELSENNKKAILKFNRKEIKELNVSSYKAGNQTLFTIYVPDSIERFATEVLSAKIKELASQLVFGIISKGLIENDIKALRLDKKFSKLVKSTKEEFNKACKLVIDT